MRTWLPLAALSLSALAAVPALADIDPLSGAPLPPVRRQTPSPITDRFYIRGSFYYPQVRSRVRVDPSPAAPGVTGTTVNGERDLGLADRLHQARVEFMFRLRERNRMRVDYFEADRSGAKVLANDIVFGNQTFAAGQLAQSSLDFRMFDLTYTYSFWRSERFEAGTGLALYFLEAAAHGAVPAQNQSQDVTAAAPFPLVPLDVAWRISRRFALTARGAYLNAHFGGFHGWLADLHEDLQYRWGPNFALGLGYSSVRISVHRAGGDFPGAFALSVSGPEAFLRFSF